MSDAESTNPHCSAEGGRTQASDDCDRSADALDWVIERLDEWLIRSADRLSWLEKNHRYQDAAFERVMHESYRQSQLLAQRAKQSTETQRAE